MLLKMLQSQKSGVKAGWGWPGLAWPRSVPAVEDGGRVGTMGTKSSWRKASSARHPNYAWKRKLLPSYQLQGKSLRGPCRSATGRFNTVKCCAGFQHSVRSEATVASSHAMPV